MAGNMAIKRDLALFSWLPLVMVVSPFGLWIVEQWLPYPYIWEELFKLAVVIRVGKTWKGKVGLIYLGLLAALWAGSETILTIMNHVLVPSGEPLIERVLLTIPMHITTFLLIALATRKRQWQWGLAGAILIHWWFNWWVALRG